MNFIIQNFYLNLFELLNKPFVLSFVFDKIMCIKFTGSVNFFLINYK